MFETHQYRNTILADSGLNASTSATPWQIWSYTKCLKPFCSLSSSLMLFDSFQSGFYFEIFFSASISLCSCTFSISHSLCLHHQTSDNKLPHLSALSQSACLHLGISLLSFCPPSISPSLQLKWSEICCCWGAQALSQGWLLYHIFYKKFELCFF